jgi:predicted ABC-type ATPase
VDGETFSILKSEDDKRLVFGWASVALTVDGEALEDRQSDMIDPEDLEEAAYDYVLNFRDTGEEHIPSMRKRGKLVESCVLTREKQRAMGIPEGIVPVGWWIGFHIDDDDAWQRVRNGTYQMFSIEGKANREPVEKSQGGGELPPRAVAKSFREVLLERGDPVHMAGPDRYDHIVEVQKFNPYHGRDGRFSSANGGATAVTLGPNGKPREYGKADTSDAAADIAAGEHNSLEKHLDKDGTLSPEREALHRKIIDEMLEGKVPVEGQATMTMLGGGPASGKSSVMSSDTSKDPHAVTIDPDAFKEKLPGYAEMAAKTDKAAGFYHEESSMLAKQFATVVYSENYNTIYDGTGDGSVKSVQKKIADARKHGYRVEAKYVSIDTEEAVRRNKKRYEDAKANGEIARKPDENIVRATHAKVSDISVACAKDFDYIEVWDNNGAKGQQKMIASGGGGKGLKVVPGQEEAFKNYLNKGTKGASGFKTLPDGQVTPAN